MKDFYSVLGLEADCTFDDIKEAYRKLSKKFHPDLNQGDDYFVSRFREVNEAYEILIDPEKRRRYDKNLKAFRPVDEEFQKRQYYRQQAENNRRQAHNTHHRPKTSSSHTGITIALVLLGLVVAVYLVESFGHSNKIKKASGDTVAVSPAPGIKPHKHHGKKHLKNRSDSAADIFSPSLEDRKFAKPSAVVEKQQPAHTGRQAKAENNKPIAVKPGGLASGRQIVAESNANTVASNSFPYSTYVRPNVTGVVNLRKSNEYSSVVIEKIPANSEVLVLQKGEVYYKVSYNNNVGYVPKWALGRK
jgi:curved DNA-binding protein CbpA